MLKAADLETIAALPSLCHEALFKLMMSLAGEKKSICASHDRSLELSSNLIAVPQSEPKEFGLLAGNKIASRIIGVVS